MALRECFLLWLRAGNVATHCANLLRCVNIGSCTTRVFVTTCSVTFATSAQAPDPRTERAPCCHLWRTSSSCPGWPFLHVEGHHWGWELGLRVWSWVNDSLCNGRVQDVSSLLHFLVHANAANVTEQGVTKTRVVQLPMFTQRSQLAQWVATLPPLNHSKKTFT
jgi:hypothetical protein